jgi:hypothetical protein
MAIEQLPSQSVCPDCMTPEFFTVAVVVDGHPVIELDGCRHCQSGMFTPSPGFTCPVCGRTSYHPTDLAEGFCGACSSYTGPRRSAGPVG